LSIRPLRGLPPLLHVGRGTVAVAVLIAALALPPVANAGRAVTGPCRTVFCAGISQDGSRVVFPFEEELVAGAGMRQIYERSSGAIRALLPAGKGHSNRLDGTSSDGAHVFVTTSMPLAPEDADGFGFDIFDVSAGAAALISTGPLDAQTGGGALASFMGSSPDGGRVFFDAFGPLTADDLDTCPDLYQRVGGQTTLVAPDLDPPLPPVCSSVAFGGVSVDGSHLFFSSGDELEPGDEHGEDIYQQVGSTFTRLTTYPEPEGNCVDLVGFVDASSDGGTVLFTTNSPVTAGDTDSTIDVYKRRPDGTFALVSRGTDGGNGQCGFVGDRAVALSADGSTAIFETAARLSPLDSDSSNDLYSTDDSGAIELVSTGPADTNVDERSIVFPDWLALVSDDARRVAFETRQPLVAVDRDTASDVYLRAAGETVLVSGSPSGKVVGSNAELLGFAGNGYAVVFATKEALVPRDLDRERDLYLWWLGDERGALISGETIAPRMRIGKRAVAPRSGRVGVRLACPKAETSGPCRGRLFLQRGWRGDRVGAARFRIDAGRRARVSVPLRRRFRASPPKSVLVRVRGADALGNARVVTRRVRLAVPRRR
jgi:hypothetical protein